jgi:hypothetical protein
MPDIVHSNALPGLAPQPGRFGSLILAVTNIHTHRAMSCPPSDPVCAEPDNQCAVMRLADTVAISLVFGDLPPAEIDPSAGRMPLTEITGRE